MKTTVLKIINPLLLLLVISQILTGIFADTIPGKSFQIVHFGGGFLLLALVITHLALNWGWIRNQYLPKKKHTPAGQTEAARR